MNKICYVIIGLLSLTSCANTFNIAGTTSVSTLDGQKLYLKVLKDTMMKNLDSCDVVHGQFQFAGSIDSVRVANIIFDNSGSIPVVLEDGSIQVKIDNTQETVSGTPLNDKLTKFRRRFTQLLNQSADLVHQHLTAQSASINQKMDKLVTSFVVENFDNVLGPYIFITVCMNRYEVPMLDAWVEDIMSRATDQFKNDPQVKEYYQAAQDNQAIMNGTKVPVQAQQPHVQVAPPQDGPTPNEMAAPAQR